MADVLNIYQKCPKCKGSGEVEIGRETDEEGNPLPTVTETCPVCNGEKELLWGQMREEELENPA